MQAFILAGGFATRLWPLTEKRAKPLLPLAGKPLLTHIAANVPAGIPITVSTNAVFRDGFEEWKNQLRRDNLEILIEDTKHDDHKLGALGAVAQWITNADVTEDVLLLTGDNYFGFQIADFLAAYEDGTPLLAAHDIREKERAKAFGTIMLAEDERTIVGFEEKPTHPKTTLVSTGCSILPDTILPVLTAYAEEHPDNVGGIFEEFQRNGQRVACFTFAEHWFDIGSFEAYLDATRALVGDQVILEEGAVNRNTETKGSIVIGARSAVHGSALENVVIFEDCTVEDCVLENCILDNHCVLKGTDLTGKMLRENTRLVNE